MSFIDPSGLAPFKPLGADSGPVAFKTFDTGNNVANYALGGLAGAGNVVLSPINAALNFLGLADRGYSAATGGRDMALDTVAAANAIQSAGYPAGAVGKMASEAITYARVGLAAGEAGETCAAALIRANAAKGAAYEDQVFDQLQGTQSDVVRQVTIKTKSGAKTRLDFVGKDADTGAYALTEAKSSATAPLTKGQTAAFPELQESGGVVVGAGKPGVPGGTVIPPTKVSVKRPLE